MKITLKDRRVVGDQKTLILQPLNYGEVVLTVARGGVDEIALDVDALELLMAARFCHRHIKQKQQEQRP